MQFEIFFPWSTVRRSVGISMIRFPLCNSKPRKLALTLFLTIILSFYFNCINEYVNLSIRVCCTFSLPIKTFARPLFTFLPAISTTVSYGNLCSHPVLSIYDVLRDIASFNLFHIFKFQMPIRHSTK